MNNNILVTRSSMPSKEEYIDEISGLWDSHWLTNMGVKHKALPLETRINKCIAHNADAEYILKSKYKVLTRV